MSRRFMLLATFITPLLAGGCFVLDRFAAVEAGSVVGSATRPDLDGSPGAGFVKITGVGSSLVRSGDADGVFTVGGLGPGRLDLRLVDDVDGDGWADRGRQVSVFVADDAPEGKLASIEVGTLPLAGSFGLRGVVTPPPNDDSRVVRIYALRGRCAVRDSDGSDSDLSAGRCDDDGADADVLARLEHGVEAEAAADSTGAWQLTRLIAGRVDIVAALYDRNTDGTLGAVVDVVGPIAIDGVATDPNDPPSDAGFDVTFGEAPPPAVNVQLVFSRAVERDDAFAVIAPPGAVVPGCARDAAELVADAIVVDVTANSVVTPVPVGAWNVVVCDGDRRGSSPSLVAVPAAADAAPLQWPIVLLDVDRCPADPLDPGDAERDCDDDDVTGLPLSTIDALRDACAAQCFPDAAQPFESLGAALGDRTCTVDGNVYDCDDDADGQPDVTEPTACIGAGRGTDLDGDGLCSVVDSYPHCATNTAGGCPVGVEAVTPRVQGGGTGSGIVRGPVGTVVSITSSDDAFDVDVEITEGADEDGITLVYGDAVFALPQGTDTSAVQISSTGPVPGIVCAVQTATPLVIGCEHGFDTVSRDDEVVSTFFESHEVVVGGLPEDDSEGRYIAFVSSASLLPGTTAGDQVFWRDRGTGVTLLISAVEGIAGNAPSFEPAISADGFSVVFTSSATNLDAADTNGSDDVFVWRVGEPDALERVSVGPGGIQGDGIASAGCIDKDGDVVAFSSTSSTLTPGVSGVSTVNVFRKSLGDGAVTLLSARDDDGTGAGGDNPSISDDGNRIAFWAFSPAIDPEDTNGLWDAFVYDVPTSLTTRVSVTATGGERNQGDEATSRITAPSISGDGRFVAWSTTADNVTTDDGNGTKQDVFVTTVDTGEVICASAGGDDNSPRGQGERVALSRDGRFITFTSGAGSFGAVVVRELPAGEAQTVIPGGAEGVSVSVGVPAISADGAYVAVCASNPLDPRSTSSGCFAVFTGLGPSWWAGR